MRSPDLGRGEAPPLWPWLAFSALAALWVNLGTIHRYHTGDNLVPVLVSVYRWTPAFWSSNHPGMLVPLLASPIKDLFLNLLVQDAINIALGLSAFFLLARYTLRDASYPVVGALGVAGFLAFAPAHYSFDFLISSYYGTFLALTLGGLVLLEPRPDGAIPRGRRLAALVLFLMAHWVYAASSVVLGPLVVFRALLSGSGRSRDAEAASEEPGRIGPRIGRLLRSEAAVSLRLMAIATVAGLAFLTLTPSHHQIESDSLPIREWPAACLNALHMTWMEFSGRPISVPNSRPEYGWPVATGWPLALAGALGFGLLCCGIPAVRSRATRALEASAALLLTALTFWAYMATRRYIADLGHFYRYFEPASFLLQGAILSLAFGPLCAALDGRSLRALRAAMVPVGALAIAVGFGPPSLSGVRADLDLTLGGRTADLIESGATHIVGDYYQVMPAMFHANMALQDRGEGRTVWGISGCSRPTLRLWRRIPKDQFRVAVLSDPATHEDPRLDPSVEPLLRIFRFPPLAVAERRPSLWLLRPESPEPPTMISARPEAPSDISLPR